MVDAPCIEAPPCTLILALGAGEAVREDVREPERTLGRSEINGPAAEGGGLVEVVDVAEVGLGSCRASGWSDKANVLAIVCCCCCFLFPVI